MSTLRQAALDELENPTLAFDRNAAGDMPGNEVALRTALTGQLSPLAARCVQWNRKYSPLCRTQAQDRNPNPQSTEPTMSFAQRHPYASHITVMDGAPLPTRPTPMMPPTGRDQEYGEMPPRGGAGPYDPDNGNGNGNNNGRNTMMPPPTRMSDPDAFRRGLNSGPNMRNGRRNGNDQTSPRPASVPSPTGYSGGLSRSRPPAISDQEGGEENGTPPISASDLIDIIKLVLPQLSPESRAQFVGNLSTLLAGLEHMNGNTNGGGNTNGANGQQYDSRSGNRTAADRALELGAVEAKRSLQARDYLRRFPGAGKIQTGGYISKY
jgi:hypothetical protein